MTHTKDVLSGKGALNVSTCPGSPSTYASGASSRPPHALVGVPSLLLFDTTPGGTGNTIRIGERLEAVAEEALASGSAPVSAAREQLLRMPADLPERALP
ncbi:hypothetical protein [Streptomyces sp. NPDC055186]